MSQENVELFRKSIDAYNRRDVEAILETWHPEGKWYLVSPRVKGGEAYHGHEGLRQWWATMQSSNEGLEVILDEVQDLDDTVLALGHIRARFGSIALDSEIGWLTRYRDGLAVWSRAYQSNAEALEAAGLSE
jgi:ketosteroid isomerase-like protein